MGSFTPFLTLLSEIEDPRRAEGKLYRLPHVTLFAILALVAGANSYRGMHSFIDVHLARLRKVFGLNWRRAPAYATIRFILQGWTQPRWNGPSGAMPRRSTNALIAPEGRAIPCNDNVTSPSTARRCATASINSTTARRPIS